MKAADTGRILTENGVGQFKIDGVTRLLRKAGHLPVGGRGANAPRLNIEQAARLVLTVAAANKASTALDRLDRVERLRSDDAQKENFFEALIDLFESPARLDLVAEVRVARNARRATIVYADGATPPRVFSSASNPDYSSRLIVEGVIPAALIRAISNLVRSGQDWPVGESSDEPDDDS